MIYLIIGIILKMTHVVNDEEVKSFTHMVFIALYPFIMFDNLYGKQIGDHMNWLLVVYVVGFTFFQIIAAWFIVCRIESEDRNRGPMIQAMFRSNIVLMGLPVGINLFGKGNVAAVAIVILFIVPLYNVVSVIVLERFRGGRANAKDMVIRVLQNPIIIGGIVAVVFMTFSIPVPGPVYQAVTTLSDLTAPIALILLGAALDLKGFSNDLRKAVICVSGKIIISPLLGITGAILLGFSGVELIAILLMVATPTALASYAMASSMGGNGQLAGEAVVMSTLLSCFTMPVWLFILKTMGLF